MMLDRLGRSQPAPDADVITRAVAVPALAALAVIHVVDLPGTLGPDRLVGIGYLGIIAGAIIAGGATIARSHWLAWAGAGGLAVRTSSAATVSQCCRRSNSSAAKVAVRSSNTVRVTPPVFTFSNTWHR
jgi:hypothetical protein